jgi:hypothetical protein
MPANKKNGRTRKAKTASKNQTSTSSVEQTVVASTTENTVEETAPVPAPVVAQTGGKAKRVRKSKAKAAAPVETVTVTETATEAATETELATVTENTAADVDQNGSGKRVRSFKVRLPGNESFEGRFTGLTPYQAANKALSKYYRETSKPKKQIQFTIRESTRGSKRSTYTYNGRREKLSTPVEYSIKDGRTITKNYKNRLTKVKKAELAALTV